jgi:hypothetical protein
VPTVASSKQVASRWRVCNSLDPPAISASGTQEDIFKDSLIGLLENLHTDGNLADLSFSVVESVMSVGSFYSREKVINRTSPYKDFAFELEGDDFRWRWETTPLGPKFSSEILSKHLILPLISTSHLSFSSGESIHDIGDDQLEKASFLSPSLGHTSSNFKAY